MELKTTLKETIGTFWKVLLIVANLVAISSLPINLWFDVKASYVMIGMGGAIQVILLGREYTIASLYRIRTITGLRERLLHYGDAEYILSDIKKECVWTGLPVPPEVNEQLTKFKENKEAFQQRVMELFSDIMKPETKESN